MLKLPSLQQTNFRARFGALGHESEELEHQHFARRLERFGRAFKAFEEQDTYILLRQPFGLRENGTGLDL